jgi:Tol biopolymer transport system component
MPVSGSEKPRRLELGDDVGGVSIAGRSNRLAYVRNVAVDTNIWRVDLSDPTLPATSIIASTRSDTNGQYSPDGWRIVFRSARSGRFEIWACNSDGSEPVQLTTTALGALPGSPRWSPDGSLIAFDAAIAGIYQIFVMAANGGGQKQMTNGANSFRPSWSHDGKWLYFTSPRSGRDEIWKVPAGGGTAVQVTRNGGSSPVVSEDGTAIYYYTYRGKFMIMRAALDGSGETRIAEQGSYSRGASQNIAPAKGGFFTGLGYPTASCFRVSRTARLTVC